MQLEDYFEFEKVDDIEKIRVKGTRVPIEMLVNEFNEGTVPEKIHERYPTVSREQVYATITYYLHNQQQKDAYIERGKELARKEYQNWKQTHKPSPWEERLQTLRSGNSPSEQGVA